MRSDQDMIFESGMVSNLPGFMRATVLAEDVDTVDASSGTSCFAKSYVHSPE